MPNILPTINAVVSGIAISPIRRPRNVHANSLDNKRLPSRDVHHESCKGRGNPEVHERIGAELHEHEFAQLVVVKIILVVAFHVYLNVVH